MALAATLAGGRGSSIILLLGFRTISMDWLSEFPEYIYSIDYALVWLLLEPFTLGKLVGRSSGSS